MIVKLVVVYTPILSSQRGLIKPSAWGSHRNFANQNNQKLCLNEEETLVMVS
jgi:hypothetical protein